MSGNKEKLSRRIERYLKNLMKALFGLDPYRDELEEAKEQVRKSAENMKTMQDHLYAALEKWDNAVTEMEKSDALATSLQTLTENLRQRLADAEDKQRHTDRAVGNLMMARQLLDKTNNGLTDLCNYMEMGDAEALREMTEGMEWSSTLLRIIKSHLQVLGRKNELEQRLTIIGNKQDWDNHNLE